MPTIRISRDSGYADRLRSYQVVVDGEVVGTVDDGGSAELEVPAGDHEVHLKLDFCRSKSVAITVDEEGVDLACGSHMRGFRVAFAIFYILLFQSDYMWLAPASSGVPRPPM